MNHSPHTPVLLKETIDALSPQKGDEYLDLTAGFGGHAAKVAGLVGKQGRLTLVDRDNDAVSYLKQHFQAADNTRIIKGDFYSAAIKLLENGRRFDCLLADLGISSYQLQADRGFTFDNKQAPLDMRMDSSQDFSALDVVNGYDKKHLKRLFIDYGEFSAKQAEALSGGIIANRPLQTTGDLLQIAKKLPAKKGKRQEAQVFQAIRIEVNDELGLLKKALPVWTRLLKPGGRMAVISFHSLEDRIVKQFFVQRSRNKYQADLILPRKKPITATQNEIVYNPRARSGKLRVAVKK